MNAIKRILLLLIFAMGMIVCFSPISTFAQKSQKLYPNSEFMNKRILFNGRDLNGWRAEGNGIWDAQSGEIIGKYDSKANQERGWLVTEDVFGNFDLRLKYKITKGGDSGVCFRVPPDDVKFAESSGYEVEILNDKDAVNGSGSLYNIQRAYERIEKNNEWNNLSIRTVGDRITITLNDSVVINILNRRSLQGVVGLQTPDNNSVVHFKDIEIIPLPYSAYHKETLYERMNNALGEWINLFNGKDLNGWHIIWGNPSYPQKDITKEPSIIVEDGKIVCKNSAAPGWIISTREFSNFILKIKWRMPLGGNSGIAIRYPFPVTFKESLRNPAYAGFEIQAISQNPEMSKEEFLESKRKNSYYMEYGMNHNLCGSIYDVASAWPYLEKPGEWNEYVIYAYEDYIITYVNGIKSAETFIPSGRSLKGSIGMQIHGGGDSAEYFEYKDIFIKEIFKLE